MKYCSHCEKEVETETKDKNNHDGLSRGLPIGLAMGNVGLGLALSPMLDSHETIEVCKECGNEI